MLSPFLFFALVPGNAFGALVASKNAWRRALALFLGAGAVISPVFLPPEWPIARTVLAFVVAGGFLRLIEVVRRPPMFSTSQRLLTSTLPLLDVRRISRRPRAFLGTSFLLAAVFGLLAWLLFLWTGDFPPVPPYAGLPSFQRTIIGSASIYLTVDAAGRFAYASLILAGFDAEKPHDEPIRSRSLAEFWGRRWNRMIARWLRDNVFLLAARRAGVTLAVLLTFAASALFHFVPLLLVLDAKRASWMASFFLAHGVLVLGESKVRLPPLLGWCATFAVLLVTAPLFVEPLLEALGR